MTEWLLLVNLNHKEIYYFYFSLKKDNLPSIELFFIRSKWNLFYHRNETEHEVDLAVSVGMVDIDLDEMQCQYLGHMVHNGEMML